MTILHKLEWRYAVKKFDIKKQVSEEDITELLKAVNLTASSYGLQPYEIIVIKNKDLQQQLLSASMNQPQVTDCSHLLVFAAKTKISESYINTYLQNIVDTRSVDMESLHEYRNMMLEGTGSMVGEKLTNWAQKQCYIALGTLLVAAADLKIDTCPMEGFDTKQYDQILDLSNRNITTTVIVSIGYRSVGDELQHAKKVRKGLDQMVHLEY